MLISSHRKPQAPAVRGHAARKALLRRAIEKATTDSTGCCARAASGRAAEQRDERAPFQLTEFHSMPASTAFHDIELAKD